MVTLPIPCPSRGVSRRRAAVLRRDRATNVVARFPGTDATSAPPGGTYDFATLPSAPSRLRRRPRVCGPIGWAVDDRPATVQPAPQARARPLLAGPRGAAGAGHAVTGGHLHHRPCRLPARAGPDLFVQRRQCRGPEDRLGRLPQLPGGSGNADVSGGPGRNTLLFTLVSQVVVIVLANILALVLSAYFQANGWSGS